jgi:hypothetical protein
MNFECNDSLTLHYSDIFFTYLINNERKCDSIITEHKFVYVYSGTHLFGEKNKKTAICGGKCIFLRRGNRISMAEQLKGSEPFN